MISQRFLQQEGLTPVGGHRVFRNRQGRYVLIRETTRRGSSHFDGDDGYDGDDSYDGNVQVFDPSYFDGDDGTDGDMDYMDGKNRERRGRRHQGGGRHPFHPNRPPGAQTQPQGQQADPMSSSHVNVAGAVPTGWCSTVVSGSATNLAAGAAQIQIRLQHDFLATDLTFDGTVAGSTVSGIFFADRLVWSTPAGVPVTVFATTGFIRNFLNGQRLHAGLDITITGATTAAGLFAATLIGMKPYSVAMGN